MFSKSCEYGIQAMIYIALHSENGSRVGLNEIADTQQVPKHFLSKILQMLVKHKLLESVKGPNGGFYLKRNPSKINLLEIVKIIDNLDIFDRCAIGLKECSDNNPCPVHHEYKIVKNKIRSTLKEKNLTILVKDIKSGKSIVSFRND